MVYQPSLNPKLQKLFDSLDEIDFPPLELDLPPQKSLKERLLEQEQQRIEEIKAHETRFSAQSHVPDDIFMRRSDPEFGFHETSTVQFTSTFSEDMKSYEKMDNSEPFPMFAKPNFECLHEKRTPVLWHEEVFDRFEDSSCLLAQIMDEHDVPRAPNAMRRIAKGESVKLQIRRYSAEEVKQRLLNGVEDLFGHFSLVPHTLQKSSKTQHERKQLLFKKYKDLMFNFDYSKRAGFDDKAELSKIKKSIKELKEFLKNPKARKPPARSTLVTLKRHLVNEVQNKMEKETEKRKSVEISDSETILPKNNTEQRSSIVIENEEQEQSTSRSDVVIPRKISREPRSSLEIIREISNSIDPITEKLIKEREIRREAVQKREQEAMDNKKREEELQLKRIAEQNQKRIEEMNRIKEVQARDQEENMRRLEAEQKRKAIEIERQRKIEEEVRQKAEAEELERIKRNINEQQDQLALQEKEKEKEAKSPEDSGSPGTSSSTPVFFDGWMRIACRMPEDWADRRDAFLTHFNWPVDDAQRDIEIEEAQRRTEGKEVNIPWENHSTTRVVPLVMPPRRPPSNPVVLGPPVVVDPIIAIEDIVHEIKLLTAPTRRNLAHAISLNTHEVDYQEVYLNKLTDKFIYPFFLSDGLYWPLLYVLEVTEAEVTEIVDHCQALVVCNSFSGKYASRHLLTSTLQEDEYPKKFDQIYNDCDGEWMEYSQKPGRFRDRMGFKAHYSKSNESYEQQRQHARTRLDDEFANEKREQTEFCKYMADYESGKEKNKSEYKNKVTTHLRLLVQDARLDKYSIREILQDEGIVDHPGTRDTPLEHWWHTHGYKIFLNRRDHEYGTLMHNICDPYERLLLPKGHNGAVDQFNEWCFTPMLASLHYQSKYMPFDVFSTRDTRHLIDRYSKYNSLISDRKFSLEHAMEVCRLTPIDKQQWTILNDQLASHFRDFPAIFQIMYDPDGDMLKKVDRRVEYLLNTVYRNRCNEWNYGIYDESTDSD